MGRGRLKKPMSGTAAGLSLALAPFCVFCRHLREESGLPCSAFPSGVPDSIMLDGYDHRQSHPGDHGIRFALDPVRERQYAEFLVLRERTSNGGGRPGHC